MRNIETQEQFVIETLEENLHLIDQKDEKRNVVVMYATEERLRSFVLDDKIPKHLRLPIVGFTLNEAFCSKLMFAGVIYALSRNEIYGLIERCWEIMSECESGGRISFSSFKFGEEASSENPTLVKTTFAMSYEL